MSDNQQQNQNQVNTGDDISESQTRKFKYKPRSVYSLLFREAEHRLYDMDDFFERAKKTRRSEQKNLEQIAAMSGENVSDGDRWGDDVPQLKEFAWLYSEFAIIGLWRCIELYRKEAMRVILGNDAAEQSFKHKEFKKELLRLNIDEEQIICAQPVNELRCLNNAIKHERQVDDKLAKFSLWQNKEDDELGDLESHYNRLRPFAKQYLEDLTDRLNNAKTPSLSPAGQVSKT